MAFGDGENDMSMLREAGIGVAMGNGDEQHLHLQQLFQRADGVDLGVEKLIDLPHPVVDLGEPALPVSLQQNRGAKKKA